MKAPTLLVLAGLALAGPPAFAEDRTDAALATSQAVIGSEVPDLSFRGVDGKQISLASLRGKPVLLTLIYTGCADVCPAVIESLAPAVDTGEEALGEGFMSGHPDMPEFKFDGDDVGAIIAYLKSIQTR